MCMIELLMRRDSVVDGENTQNVIVRSPECAKKTCEATILESVREKVRYIKIPNPPLRQNTPPASALLRADTFFMHVSTD